MRGNTERKKPSRVDTEEYVNILEDFYILNKFVMLTDDVMFVIENYLLITPERKMKLTTVEHSPSPIDKSISKILNKVKNFYEEGGLIILVILMDLEFDKVAEILVKVEAIIAVEIEHVG